MTTFKIPEFNLTGFHAAIAKLNKVCVKLGKPAVTVVKTGTEMKIIHPAEKFDSTGYPNPIRSIELTIVEVEGVAPQIDGWSFKSLLNTEDGDKYIRSVPGFNLPEELRTREVCDHCKINRKRNSYFFVANEEGDLKQVGSSCVKDFLGHSTPATIAAWFELIAAIGEFEEYDEEDGFGPRARPVFDLNWIIHVVMEIIKQHGFVSRKKADETGNVSTGQSVHGFLEAIQKGEFKVPAMDEVKIAEFIAFFNTQEDKEGSDYVYNVKQTINNESGYIAPRKFGVLAAAINSWMRHNVEASAVPSEFFGAVGDKKVELELTVFNVFAYEGNYGVNYTNIMKDADSRVFIWKTTKDLGKGNAVKLVGTIKDHEEYRNVKQTILTRCKVV